MIGLVMAMNPILEGAGQIAGIVICLFMLIFVLLAVGFNLLMAFAMTWLYEKVDLIKRLRPTIESINKASESVSKGVTVDANENKLIRSFASFPARMQNIDKKVDKSTDRASNAVIEFRARIVQVQTIAKAFFLPGLMGRKPVPPANNESRVFTNPSS